MSAFGIAINGKLSKKYSKCDTNVNHEYIINRNHGSSEKYMSNESVEIISDQDDEDFQNRRVLGMVVVRLNFFPSGDDLFPFPSLESFIEE